jgi:outer membrane PBP1 activator LpoA protein
MRVLIATTALCLLAACSTTPQKTSGLTPKPTIQADPLSEARARNQHWLNPRLIDGFPEGTDSNYRPAARLAVLLPQTGSLGVAGNAIRDGILAGYYAETRQKPSIRFYNSQGTADGAKTAYQRALKDGAQMIIGPIGKDEVSAIAEMADGIPVLALNNVLNPTNKFLLNFSLTPEREGELLAEHLLSKNLKQAALFYQANESNTRVLAAFETVYTKSGGSVVFKANTPQFGKDETTGAIINPSLPDGLSQVKAVVLLMSGTAAKSTRAALALNGASALPVFANSEITDNAGPKTNSQLDGVLFLHMPWQTGASNALGINAAQLKALPSARGGGSRLNAFGLDAWLISTRLQTWLNSPNTAINGATGSLHLEPDGQIERNLLWSVFQNGTPQTANVSQP